MKPVSDEEDFDELDESRGGFAMFEARAKSSRGADDALWRTGFQSAHRSGQEASVAEYVWTTFQTYFGPGSSPDGVLLDVGGGSGPLCEAMTELCVSAGWRHVVVDSPAMLAHLDEHDSRTAVGGAFPAVLDEGLLNGVRPSLVVAYSVLQYVHRDMPISTFIDGIAACLSPGTTAVLGDIPNRSKRRRHLEASGEMGAIASEPSENDITDELVLEASRYSRGLGLDAFVLPQPQSVRTWRHREDLWLYRPADTPYLEEWK